MVFGLLMVSNIATAQQTIWNNDPAHSQLGFEVKHTNVSRVRGKFDSFHIVAKTSKADYSDAQISLTAQVKSINTGVEMRDNHLRTADFFDVEKFPTLTFKSTRLKKVKKIRGRLTGNLTMHGVTRPVTLDVQFFGIITSPMTKKQVAGFRITGSVNRSDFGIAPQYLPDFIGNTIYITADVEFSPQD
ncbi:YceI family protein [Prevotella sp. DNF00663]|uniref:YceI family protein n=1 Tax=Prevotella sp. DNF00663 TaxID=1384078 RepID=UPI000ACB5E59|nr:YceI family protein [Prevotella sp. DNF00663]